MPSPMLSTGRRLLLVVNRHSRRGAEAADAAFALLERGGMQVVNESCEDSAGLPGLIRGMAPKVDGVVIGGGDGTLNAAIPGLIDTGLALGILPLGTANDLARTLGIPTDLAAATQIVLNGRVKRIDVGEVNGRPFFNVASLGFGVDLTRALTRDSKRRWGRLGYVVAAFRALGRLQPFTVEVVQGNSVRTIRTVHVGIGNGRHYGSGMTISQDAAIDDGRLDLYSLDVASPWQLLRLLPALRTGNFDRWTEVHTLASDEIVIRTHRPRSVNADGEIVTRTPAHFRVLPAAVRVLAP